MKTLSLPVIPVKKIQSALKKTPAGKSLRGSIRYSPYRQPKEKVAYWKKVLGPSAVVYSHMELVYKITRTFLAYELKHRPKLFTLKQQRILLLAALIHDWGEAMVNDDSVGDIPYYLKKEEHEKKEAEIFKKVLSSLKLDQNLKKELDNAYQEVVLDKNNKLYDFFRAVEDCEYIMTALNVYRKGEGRHPRIIKEKILIGSVLSIAIWDVIKVTHNYLSVSYFLKQREPEITAMFEYSKEEFKDSKDFTMKSKTADIEAAWDKWYKFLSTKK